MLAHVTAVGRWIYLCDAFFVYDFARALFHERPALALGDIGFVVHRKSPVFIDCVLVFIICTDADAHSDATLWNHVDVCSVLSKDCNLHPIETALEFVSLYS